VSFGPVVQWLRRVPDLDKTQVRFLAGPSKTKMPTKKEIKNKKEKSTKVLEKLFGSLK
jgi:hypothetical protein